MLKVAVQIVRFIDDSQPGWVECEFADADGRRHTLRDKAPIFRTEPLDARSHYPQPGVAACEVIARWMNQEGQEFARITTARPFGIESTEGRSEFVVAAEMLTDDGEA